MIFEHRHAEGLPKAVLVPRLASAPVDYRSTSR